jgi:hypothetical protein
MENYAAGEISPSELQLLQEHARRCLDCGALLELHGELSTMDTPNHVAPEADLRAMRNSVLKQIARNGQSGGVKHVDRVPAGVLLSSPARIAFGAAALLLVGLFVGHSFSNPSVFDEGVLINELARQARSMSGPNPYWDSPVSYANVAVGGVNNGQVDLEFDACRRVDLVASLDSKLTREVLVHAILNPASLGGRLQAMEVAAVNSDSRLARALAEIMHKSDELAVRLAAMDALTRIPERSGLQEALLVTLRDDESVQMRLLALEHLVNGSVSPELINQTINRSTMASNAAVFEYAREIGASTTEEPWF